MKCLFPSNRSEVHVQYLNGIRFNPKMISLKISHLHYCNGGSKGPAFEFELFRTCFVGRVGLEMTMCVFVNWCLNRFH